MLLTTGAMMLPTKVSSQPKNSGSGFTRDSSAQIGWTSSSLLPTSLSRHTKKSVLSKPRSTSSRVTVPVSILEATRTDHQGKVGESSYNNVAKTSLNPSEVLLEKFANSPPPLETSETEAADRLFLWDDVPKIGKNLWRTWIKDEWILQWLIVNCLQSAARECRCCDQFLNFFGFVRVMSLIDCWRLASFLTLTNFFLDVFLSQRRSRSSACMSLMNSTGTVLQFWSSAGRLSTNLTQTPGLISMLLEIKFNLQIRYDLHRQYQHLSFSTTYKCICRSICGQTFVTWLKSPLKAAVWNNSRCQFKESTREYFPAIIPEVINIVSISQCNSCWRALSQKWNVNTSELWHHNHGYKLNYPGYWCKFEICDVSLLDVLWPIRRK